ncbi:MAG: oxidoreductase, partial [Arenibacter sp.]
MKEDLKGNKAAITPEEIDNCIALLQQLVDHTDQIFEIPKEKRTALIKVSGQFSRPNREEFARRKKDGKKIALRKKAARDKNARKETGIRSAREAHVFVAPKLLAAAALENHKKQELEVARNCYVCKTEFSELHHFYDTMCIECGDFNYAKRFQT